MRVFGTPQQEVFHRFALVAACWTSSAIDLLETVEVSVEWGMSNPELKDKTGKTSWYSVVTCQR